MVDAAPFVRVCICVIRCYLCDGSLPVGLWAKLLDGLRASKEESLATLTGERCILIRCCLCYG
jgi:hypothetical protein